MNTIKNETLTAILLTCLVSPGIMAAEMNVYSIGDKALGGTVFFVTAKGTHGLVAANTDQGKTYMARGADFCSDSRLFDTEGQAYADWKMPTGTQLKLLYDERMVMENLKADRYWAVSGDMLRNFKNGNRDYDDFSHDHWIRCIRVF